MPSLAVYSICNERFFLGLVALVNSLRIHGVEAPVVVVDCGLSERQRGLLAPQTTIVPAPPDVEPHLLKYVGPMQKPADSMLLVDADMIITRSLEPILCDVQAGKIV